MLGPFLCVGGVAGGASRLWSHGEDLKTSGLAVESRGKALAFVAAVSSPDIFGQWNKSYVGEFVMTVAVEPVDRSSLHLVRAVAFPQKFKIGQLEKVMDTLAAIIFVANKSRIVAALNDVSQDGAQSVIEAACHHALVIAKPRSIPRQVGSFRFELCRVVRARRATVALTLLSLRRFAHDAPHCRTACAATILLARRSKLAFRALAAAVLQRDPQYFCHSFFCLNSLLQTLHLRIFKNISICDTS